MSEQKTPNTLKNSAELIGAQRHRTSEALRYLSDLVGRPKMTLNQLSVLFLLAEVGEEGITMKEVSTSYGERAPFVSNFKSAVTEGSPKPMLTAAKDSVNKKTDRMWINDYGLEVVNTALAIIAGKARYSSKQRRVVSLKPAKA